MLVAEFQRRRFNLHLTGLIREKVGTLPRI
jgi:hypothetical protein